MASKFDELQKLHAALSKGVLSNEEFNTAKAELLRPPKKRFPLAAILTVGQKLAWPAVALLFLWLFYAPLREKLVESSEIGLGSFTMKVGEGAFRLGNPQLLKGLQRLTPEAVKTLMNIPTDGSLTLFGEYGNGKIRIPDRFDAYVQLQKAGFVESEGGDLKQLYDSLIKTRRLHYELRYRDPRGIGYTDALSENYSQAIPVPFLLSSDFSGESPPNPSVKLTEKGRNAARIIVDAVADVISKEPEKVTDQTAKSVIKTETP